jgi:diaminohydroxyphosphoribosylaminopyrimidine deaminase / 5-amino-6-(5-phosphoribosylamino)uracil reductase
LPVMPDHAAAMRAAIAEAERARGSTGDNPWVGCVICDDQGAVLASGHTQGPGEDHAEIVALRHCESRRISLAGATLYSTLEPCSFHGRTPACARAIIERGVRRVVTGIRDPNPRVDGAGNQILRDAGVEVLEGVCASEVTRSLADWIFAYYPDVPLRHIRKLSDAPGSSRSETASELCELYGLDLTRALEMVSRVLDRAAQPAEPSAGPGRDSSK